MKRPVWLQHRVCCCISAGRAGAEGLVAALRGRPGARAVRVEGAQGRCIAATARPLGHHPTRLPSAVIVPLYLPSQLL